VSEIPHQLQERGVQVCERTVEHLMHRSEELVTVHLHEKERIRQRMEEQGRAMLALDGFQPDVGQEVLWVIREVLSGEILLARALLSSTGEDLAALLSEIKESLTVPVQGLLSDGQKSIRQAVASVFAEVPHQLCHFHSLREAAKPIYDADRHAKKELKKQVRGIRAIERGLEEEREEEAQTVRDSCQANQRVQRVPADLIGVIPTAATGSLFGFLYVDEEKLPDTAPGEAESSSSTRDRRLTAFQYSHIGRWYLLRFPDLLAKLGYPGPHVLATSGTSWLPDSAALHLSVAPQAVLEPNPRCQQAIARSQFYFTPQRDPTTGETIPVSGSGDLESNVALVATCLAERPNPQTALLQTDRVWLEREGATKAEWRDLCLLLGVDEEDEDE
jgi:hypothetical protein